MTEQSMFFEDGSYYDQVVFARFLKDIFQHNGVVRSIDSELAVTVNSPANMAVNVNPGRSYINGYFHEILTDPVQLVLDASDTTNPRIDRVVLRLNVNSPRNIRVAILKGTASADPEPPALTQTSALWEEPLYQVKVRANTLTIISTDLTDERQYMWMNRDNMPKASKTEFGSVKCGSGIDVTDGVISTTISKINVSLTGATPIGYMENVGLKPSDTDWHTCTGEHRYISGITVENTPAGDIHLYQGFALNQFVGGVPKTLKINANASISPLESGGQSVTTAKLYRNTYATSNLLGTATATATPSYPFNDQSTSVTLPDDFDFDTETLYFDYQNSTTVSSGTGRARLSGTGTRSTVYLHE